MSTSSIHSPIQSLPIFNTGLPSRNEVLNTNTAICLRIFNFLTSELTASTAVCRSWNRFWQELIPGDARDILTPLVHRKLLSWQESILYAPLASFINASIVDLKMNSGVVHHKNQESYILAPQPLVQYGNSEFVIRNQINIEMNKKDQDPILLKTKERKKVVISHIAVENQFAFALRLDGKIIQWNSETETIIQEFETVYCKRNDEIINRKKLEELTCPTEFDISAAQFYVKNGRMIIYSNNKMRDDNFIEIIPYEKLKKSRVIRDRPFCYFSNLILQNDLMIGMGKALKNHSDSENAIWIRNLVTDETTSYATQLTSDSVGPGTLAMDQNKLYIYICRKSSHKALQIFDLKTKMISTHVFKQSLNLHKYVIIDGLMFGAYCEGKYDPHHYRPERFCIQDLHSKATLTEIVSSKLSDPGSAEEPELLIEEFITKAKRKITNRKLGIVEPILATEDASCVCVIS